MAEVWGSRPAPHHRRDQGRSVPVEVRHLTTTAVVDTVWLNGALGGRIVLDGELNTVISFVIDDGRISRMYAIRNPHKLGRLNQEAVIAR